MDPHGYPDEQELSAIKAWDAIKDPVGLVNYVIERWWVSSDGAKLDLDKGTLELHTWGWSGNESLIEALEENTMFWTFFWQKSERGGHFWFDDSMCAEGLKWKTSSRYSRASSTPAPSTATGTASVRRQ